MRSPLDLATLICAVAFPIAGSVMVATPAQAQAALDPAFLNEIQGRWISRFEDNDTEIEVTGREIRVVRIKPVTYNAAVPPQLRYNPQPGDLVGIIESAAVSGSVKSLIKGLPDRSTYRTRSRCVSNHGSEYRMTAAADCSGDMGAHTHLVRGSGGFNEPVFDFRTFAPGVMVHGNGDFWRPEVKQKIFGGQTATAVAPARRPATTPGRASSVGSPPPPPAPISIPVTAEQEQRELAERERLNREQAEFGTRQLAENEANRLAYEKALRDREATIARQQAEYEAELAAVEAERQRLEREHASRMAQWRADMEACKKGDKSKCAK